MVDFGQDVPAGPHREMIKMKDGTFKPASPIDNRSISDKK
jgi:hypothetical protein